MSIKDYTLIFEHLELLQAEVGAEANADSDEANEATEIEQLAEIVRQLQPQQYYLQTVT